MDITVGRTVLYTLSEQDATEINRRRTTAHSIAERMKIQISDKECITPLLAWPTGAQAHIGNEAAEGKVYPAVAVAVWSATCANLQVILDGNDTYWATSRNEGTLPGNWAWPARS
jgi:hypothetical protein